jgi:murein biosynthesis integral membrane protein MurJ
VTDRQLSSPTEAAGDSLTVGAWTIVSRVTGVARFACIGAVLGPTFFGNTYQFTNSLPNLIYYGFLAGSLFSSLLVPAMVRHIDTGDLRSARRIAGGFLGATMLALAIVAPIAVALGPFVLRLASAGGGQHLAGAAEIHVGRLLILMFAPQIFCYAIVGTSMAVMNSRQRFALAAGAPAVENLGTIAVLLAAAAIYGTGTTVSNVPTGEMLLLGLGSTGAVVLHAATQWWGARRVGVTLLPTRGWRDPEVRAIIRRALPSLAQAGLLALQVLALVAVANRLPGGVVAFQIALNFYYLAIALGATPVALSLLPRLARLDQDGNVTDFRDTLNRGFALGFFVTVPAAVAYLVLAQPLARAISFGRMDSAAGVTMVAATLAALSVAVVSQTAFMIATYASYARKNTRSPLISMLLQAVICLGLVGASVAVHGPAMLFALGLALSVATTVAAVHLSVRVRHGLRVGPGGGISHDATQRLGPSLVRFLVGAAVMAGPAWLTATFVNHWLGRPFGPRLGVVAAALVGVGIYLAVQAVCRTPELSWLSSGFSYARSKRATRRGAHAGGRPAPHLPYFRTLKRGCLPGEGSARIVGMANADAWPARWPLRPADDVIRWFGEIGRRRALDLGLLLVPFMVGVLAAVKLKYGLLAVVALVIIGVVVVRPVLAAYGLIFLTPLIVGINAGAIVPALRPNEALIVLFGLAIAVRWLAGLRSGEFRLPKFDRVDVSLIALGITSSVLPLLMMLVRQRAITSDDLLYCIVIWKLMAEYVIVRTVVTTREQALRCLILAMLAAAVVCAVGVVQSLNLFGVPGLLAKYYAPLDVTAPLSDGRGSSLLGLPAATADLAILSLGIAVAMISRGYPRRLLLGGLAMLFAIGVVAAAEFSTVIGLLVAVVALVVFTKSGRLLLWAIPVALIGGTALWPVIEIRLGGFHSATGLPVSWLDRLYNLRTYFWPVLFSDKNWILGVRPSARIATSSRQYGYVWIESGYTWLLWGGGIPLLASYFAFATTLLKKCWSYVRRADPAGVAATAVAASMCSQLVLMIFDPHLTYRGSGDLFFMLLALVRILPGRVQPAGERQLVTARPGQLQESLIRT